MRVDHRGVVQNEVDCPDELLPEPPADRLVRTGPAGRCYAWPHEEADGERGGRVRCPRTGPTVQLPVAREVELGGRQFFRNEDGSRCYRQVWANPPYGEPIDVCPDALQPGLIGTAEQYCRGKFRDIWVQCGPPLVPPTHLSGRVISVEAASSRRRDRKRSVVVVRLRDDHIVERDWTGVVLDKSGAELAAFTIKSVAKDWVRGEVALPAARLQKTARHVRLMSPDYLPVP